MMLGANAPKRNFIPAVLVVVFFLMLCVVLFVPVPVALKNVVGFSEDQQPSPMISLTATTAATTTLSPTTTAVPVTTTLSPLSSAEADMKRAAPGHILHQMYKTADNLPSGFVEFQASCRRVYSDWHYQFWTNELLDDMMSSRFPSRVQQWRELTPTIKKWDFARYALLQAYGGLYLDMDFECVRKIPDQDANIITLWTARGKHSGNTFPDVMAASRPGHAFWDFIMTSIFSKSTVGNVLDITGPRALNHYMSVYRSGNQTRDLPDKIDLRDYWKEMSPYSYDNAAKQKECLVILCADQFPNVIGVHHYRGSWVHK